MSDEKDPFAEDSKYAGEAEGVDEFDILDGFEEFELEATADDFNFVKAFGGEYVPPAEGDWIPVVILAAHLIKGTQDWNLGENQLEIYAEHLAPKHAGKRFPYRTWIPLTEQMSKDKTKKWRPGETLFAATGLMEKPKSGEKSSRLKITRDMVDKGIDSEGNDVIVLPALEGKEIMVRVRKVVPGKVVTIPDENGQPKLDENGEEMTRQNDPKEQLYDMVSELPNLVIQVHGARETRSMIVSYDDSAKLMLPIRSETTLDAVDEQTGEVHTVRRQGSRWLLVHPAVEQRAEVVDAFN
ncbi:hypothetical protein ABT282_07785 [Streptomyces sp. NPDC000927]|uniref:hypothetical protein n=1 Tax=Streptomyces sp. NPDC000927 TaxID=3154371 RepID=UPI003321ED96